MTEHEIRALLAAAVAYDNRRPSNANIAAWLEAATRANWTFAEALDAIHDHNAENPEFLKPAHITQRIRATRGTGQPPAYRPELPTAAPADDSTRRRIMAMVGDRFSLRMRRERRPEPQSAEHHEARERARAELDRLRKASGGAS